jgi:CRP-like cAMP-binding protein
VTVFKGDMSTTRDAETNLAIWLRRIDPAGRLTASARDALGSSVGRVRPFQARETLFHEGDAPSDAVLVLEGIAARVKEQPSGGRAIVALLLPGELCNGGLQLFRHLEHSLRALTDGRAARIATATLQRLEAQHPELHAALLRAAAQDDALAREWIVNLEVRSAQGRVAHLLCELFVRLQALGLAAGATCAVPLLQQDIGDATGLSAVHVSRVLQALRRAGVVRLGRGALEILNFPRLADMAAFRPDYLELLEAV